MKNAIIYSFAFCLLCVLGCNDDCENPTNPDCDNYDPCYGIAPVTASFKTYEYVIGLDDWLDNFDMQQAPMVDDTAVSNDIFFEAPEGFTKYTWTIGAETIQERTFSRSHFPRGVNIPVQLIVEGATNPCFPKEDGIDTIVKTLYFTNQTSFDADIQYIHLTTGTFHGAYVDTPSDTFTISITQFWLDDLHPVYDYQPRIYNLPPNVCDVLISHWEPKTRNQMVFATQGDTDLDNCGRPAGIATATQDSIDIQYLDLFDNRKFYHFRGKRIK